MKRLIAAAMLIVVGCSTPSDHVDQAQGDNKPPDEVATDRSGDTAGDVETQSEPLKVTLHVVDMNQRLKIM